MGAELTRRLLCGSLLTLAFSPHPAFSASPPVTVHKDPDCGCCGGWISHLELRGFNVKTLLTKQLNREKARLGVPAELWACHTAEVDGYVIEGHVPAAALEKLLREKPKARGLAVPGMPSGSPGMTGEYEEYDVILFRKEGNRVYGRFKGETEI